MNKYVAAVRTLVQNGRQQEARESLSELEASVAGLRGASDTGDAVIDGVLLYASKKAADCGVTLSVNACVGPQPGISAQDLFVIMGNTLDNAVEAAAALPEGGDKTVAVTLQRQNGVLRYVVSNEYDRNAGNKKDGAHGYGLKNVRSIVHRREGNMTVEKKNGRFTLSILLNCGPRQPSEGDG